MSIKQLSRNRYQLNASYYDNGKRIRKSKIVECSGKKEAQRLEREFLVELRSEKEQSDCTVDKMLENYIATAELLGLKPTTARAYNATRRQLFPFLGKKMARTVTSYAIQETVLEMAKNLSPKTVKNAVSVLSSAYENAIKLGELAENPCRGVTLPKQKKKEVEILEKEDAPRFLECLNNEPLDFQCAILLALFCGLRRSEICGLESQDINLNFKTVTVRQSRHIVNGKSVIQTPKTNKSRRTLALPSILVEKLSDLEREHRELPFEVTSFLIQNGLGEPMSPATINSHLNRFEARNNLPHITAHKLRHTFASWLINSKQIDIAQVSAELGHSNITTTLNVYTHAVGGVSVSSRAIASATDDFVADFVRNGQIDSQKAK